MLSALACLFMIKTRSHQIWEVFVRAQSACNLLKCVFMWYHDHMLHLSVWSSTQAQLSHTCDARHVGTCLLMNCLTMALALYGIIIQRMRQNSKQVKIHTFILLKDPRVFFLFFNGIILQHKHFNCLLWLKNHELVTFECKIVHICLIPIFSITRH